MPDAADTIRLRACAIIRHRQRILLSRASIDPFWALPGGRIEPGETSAAALLRELREELDLVDVRLDRLVFVVENRFAYAGRRIYEVGFTYEVRLKGAGEQEPGTIESVEADLRIAWFELGDLPGLDLRPQPLRDRLIDPLPRGVEHLVVDQLG